MMELLSGKISRFVSEALLDPKDRLFPTEKEIHPKCSCGSGAAFCPHVSAALYGLANRLDRNPGHVFLLRSVNAEDLISEDLSPEKAETPAQGHEALPSPVITASPIPPNSIPAVVVRRRNGREERLELRDPAQDSQKANNVTILEDPFDSDEIVVRRKRLPRQFSKRRKRTGWKDVPVSNDDEEPTPPGGQSGPTTDSSVGSPEWAQGIVTQTGEGKRKSGKTIEIDLAQIASLGNSGEDGAGEDLTKPPKKRRSMVSKMSGTMPSPITSREELWRRIEAQQDPAERAVIHTKALELIKGANAKKMKKLEQQETAARKKRDMVDNKRKDAAKRAKEAKEKANNPPKTPPKAPSKKFFPAKLSAAVPDIDFDRVTGKNIRELRKSMGWSLDVFSDRLGICKATVDRWESTRGPLSLYTPSMEALKKLYKSINKKFGA
jgi:uncharacterized Zn finger protein